MKIFTKNKEERGEVVGIRGGVVDEEGERGGRVTKNFERVFDVFFGCVGEGGSGRSGRGGGGGGGGGGGRGRGRGIFGGEINGRRGRQEGVFFVL